MAPDWSEGLTLLLFAICSIARMTLRNVLLTLARSRASFGVAESRTSPRSEIDLKTSLLNSRRSGMSAAMPSSSAALPFIDMTVFRAIQMESSRSRIETASSPVNIPSIAARRRRSRGSSAPTSPISPTVDSISAACAVSSCNRSTSSR